MSELIVKCDLCGEVIAKTTEEALSFPMTGAMFKSPDQDHGIPDPFDVSLSWEELRCPYGRTHRPFISQDAISTTTGRYRVAKNGDKGSFVENMPEIGRESVIDSPRVPTDEQAEAITRAEIGDEPIENKEKAAPEIVSHETNKVTCDVCGREIGKRGYIAHRKSHKGIENA